MYIKIRFFLMTIPRTGGCASLLRAFAAMALITGFAACATPGPGESPDGIFDPQEPANRRVHSFNKKIYSGLSGKGDGGMISSLPQPVKSGVVNFSDTVALPQTVVNQILQGRLLRASRNTLRFSVNATLGIAGLMDVASPMGLPEDRSNFGETLFVWGFPEGAYMELPVLGPSTERETVGLFVDFFTDPFAYVLPSPQRYVRYGARLGELAIKRSDYGDAIDAVLTGSADSYAQARVIWLEKRRHELGDDSIEGAGFIDPEALDTEGF
ncbi:VacJ family lipoprotein [Salipiger sp. PrR002]|uniref:MlaA family lipoprotein n=1 Tax=Salipiger sp. PrR002 TaxID=2706489 RepID=UPI001F17C8F9|nr:VacJ family lipoprotein [Salipiger sp. PrR002]